MRPADDARNPGHRPRALSHQRDEVGPVDAVHDEAGATVLEHGAVHFRNVDSAGGGEAHRRFLPPHTLQVAISAKQAEHGVVAPGEDLGFAALPDPSATGDSIALGHGLRLADDERYVAIRALLVLPVPAMGS